MTTEQNMSMSNTKGQRIGYCRVSTLDQSTARQLDGVLVDRIFEDKASGRDTHRPALAECLKYLRDGDTLVVHSLDRLARNAEDLLRIVRELTGRGVCVTFYKEGLRFGAGSADPMATLMLTLLGAFAQFERALIRERQREGIAIARRAGIYKGRKPSLSPEQVADLRRRASEPGANKSALARELKLSRETVYQYLRQTSPAGAA
jgi:DNA invertase Pin-like site-specific DNA recombinase